MLSQYSLWTVYIESISIIMNCTIYIKQHNIDAKNQSVATSRTFNILANTA